LIRRQIRFLIDDLHTAASPRAGVSSGASREQPGGELIGFERTFPRRPALPEPLSTAGRRAPMGAKLRVAVVVALSATAGSKPRPYNNDRRRKRNTPGVPVCRLTGAEVACLFQGHGATRFSGPWGHPPGEHDTDFQGHGA